MGKSWRISHSSKKENPFQGRGLDKFNQVHSELETMRATIAAREGVSTTDVWFMRGTNNGGEDGHWIPLVVGRKKRSSVSEDRHHQQPQQKQEQLEYNRTTSEISASSSMASQEAAAAAAAACWISQKLEQLLQKSQQVARRALKALTLFIMVAAAVGDVLVALIAEFISWMCGPRRNREPEETSPSTCFGPKRRSSGSCSAPNSPLHPRATSKMVSVSTPSSPAGKAGTTFFNSGSNSGPSSGSNSGPSSGSTSVGATTSTSSSLRDQVRAPVVRKSDDDGTTVPLLLIVLVILMSLSLGRTAAALLAALGWFVTPTIKAIVTTFSNRHALPSNKHGANKQQ